MLRYVRRICLRMLEHVSCILEVVWWWKKMSEGPELTIMLEVPKTFQRKCLNMSGTLIRHLGIIKTPQKTKPYKKQKNNESQKMFPYFGPYLTLFWSPKGVMQIENLLVGTGQGRPIFWLEKMSYSFAVCYGFLGVPGLLLFCYVLS